MVLALPDPVWTGPMVARFTDAVGTIGRLQNPLLDASSMPNRTITRGPLTRAVHVVRPFVRRGRTEADWWRSRRERADVAVFNDFHPPPYGGGNQFLLALLSEFERRGLDVEVNRLSGATPVCLFNSFTFDFARLRRFVRAGARMVHRVDGPIGVYRGFDDGTDRRIARINAEFADATVFQSQWSLEKHRELGFDLRAPVVAHNAVDPTIFHPPPHREPPDDRPLRVVTTSWSDNLRKGADILEWLDCHHDPRRLELTFVGNTQRSFERIRFIAAVPSRQVAELLRRHDVYLAPSRDDPCSNALLEALACGLPAAYLRSGGHPELVGEGGIGFDLAEELPAVLDRLRDELAVRRATIRVPALADVADRYLEALRG
jgi:glycosyltransferase involved in cell wall biosynthesis